MIYVKCMQKFQNALDSVGMVGLGGLLSLQNRLIRTLPDWLRRPDFFWGQEVGSSNLPSPTPFALLTYGVSPRGETPEHRAPCDRREAEKHRGKWVVRQVGSDPRTGKRRVNQLATFDTKKAAAEHKQLIVDGRIGVSTETVAGFVEGS